MPLDGKPLKITLQTKVQSERGSGSGAGDRGEGGQRTVIIGGGGAVGVARVAGAARAVVAPAGLRGRGGEAQLG